MTISDSVVIMTRDEYRERLEAEFSRGVSAALDDKSVLYQRAALKDHGLSVVYSTDGLARVHVSRALDNGLGDCLTLRWSNEVNNPDHVWYYAHFSPARARLIARFMVERAAHLEEANGVETIDPIPEKMRKGPVGVET